LNILFIGDLVGSDGRRILREALPDLKKTRDVDLCIANVENAAAGLGLTSNLAREISSYGVDLMTLGNHSWARAELLDRIDQIDNLIRPANGPASWPGRGSVVYSHAQGKILVINLLGRIFMNPVDDPFAAVDQILEKHNTQNTPLALVDFHAEATSEKIAMGWYLDGRVTAMVGTHTHVQTADEGILDHGTAYITDVGMTGPVKSVIGMDKASSFRRIIDHLPSRYRVAQGSSALCAVLIQADPTTGKAVSIERIRVEE
jgi:2',3'-cyclic-nucleotide 2'-phosphodiesterase